MTDRQDVDDLIPDTEQPDKPLGARPSLVERIAEMPVAELVSLDEDGLSTEEVRALDDRLEQLRTEREQAQDETRKKKERGAAKRRNLFEATVLPALVDAHGEVDEGLIVIEYNGGFVALKRPHPAVFKRFSDAKRINYDTCERFARPCIVYPDKGKLDAVFDSAPGLVIECANKLVDFARRKKDEQGKG